MAGAVVMFLIVAVAALWFIGVPNWRPPLREGERYGIDVSSHQEEIDWQQVADDDIEFAYIKATEGGDLVDDFFDANWSGAGSVGIERGAYHFFTLCTPAEEQAENFLRVAPPDPDALAPAVDLEIAGNCGDRPPRSDVLEEVQKFVDLVEEAWGRPIVAYVGHDWHTDYPGTAPTDRPQWIRKFMLRPSDDWYIWQLHGYASIEGVEGDVDFNVMREP